MEHRLLRKRNLSVTQMPSSTKSVGGEIRLITNGSFLYMLFIRNLKNSITLREILVGLK